MIDERRRAYWNLFKPIYHVTRWINRYHQRSHPLRSSVFVLVITLVGLTLFVDPIGSYAQQISLNQNGCICSISSMNWMKETTTKTRTNLHDQTTPTTATDSSYPTPIAPVTPTTIQTAFDMTRGIPSLSVLQQPTVYEYIYVQGNGSTTIDMVMEELQEVLPQMSGGSITCNEFCVINQMQFASPSDGLNQWSHNDDFLTVTVGFDGQVCGIHAGGGVSGDVPYLVECIGPNDNTQLNYPPGLQAYVIESGQDNTCVITLNYTVLCWGGLDSQGENDPPTNFTDGSMIVESIHLKSTAACGIGHSSSITDWTQVRTNSLLCWGLAALNNFLGDGLVIPTLPIGVRWIEVVLTSTQNSGMFGLALDSEGTVWNLPCVQMNLPPSTVPQSKLFPMIHLSMGDHVACGITDASNQFQVLCWLTQFALNVMTRQEYNMIHSNPIPPASLMLISIEYSEIKCFGDMCAGVASNLYNNVVVWGAPNDEDGTAETILGDPRYLPPQANLFDISLGHDQACLTTRDGRINCFSTDPTIPYDSMPQLQTWIWDSYLQMNPFATSYSFGNELIQSMQFSQISIGKGLMDCVGEYVVYLQTMSNVGCVFPITPPANTSDSIPTGGFFYGVFGTNTFNPNFTIGATVKHIESATGYFCYMDIYDAISCTQYEGDQQGVVLVAPNLDPLAINGTATQYNSFTVGQGFWCVLRRDDSMWCNNASVSNPGLAPLNPSIDVGLNAWSLPQWSHDATVRSTAFLMVSAGDVQLCAIYKSNQTVVCWGYYVVYNRTMIIQIDRVLSTVYPITPIPTHLQTTRFLSIACGTRVTCGLVWPEGNATCWGLCDANQCQVPLTRTGTNYTFTKLSVGSDTVCGITSDSSSTLVCWGKNFNITSSTSEPIFPPTTPLPSPQPTPSTVGNFAPLNTYSIGAQIRVCPPGTISLNAGSRSSMCSGVCGSGSYANVTPLQATLHQGSATVQSNVCPATPNSPKGTFAPAGSSLPIPCPPGRFGSSTGLQNSDCSGLCVPGFYCPLGTGDATSYPCEAGRYGNTTGLVDPECDGPCQLGYYCLAGSRTPTSYICPNPSFICPIGSGSPIAVTDGYYSFTTLGNMTAGEGMTNQTICPIGQFCKSGIMKPCAAGSYSDTLGSATCTLCMPGRFTGGEGSTVCDFCPPGTYSNTTGSSECLPCPSGAASPINGSLICSQCEPGTASLGGSPTCDTCAANTYAPVGGMMVCATCTYPNIVDRNKTECLSPRLCEPGTYSVLVVTDENYPVGACQPCAPGSYSSSMGSVGSCTSCEASTYNLPLGSTTCFECPSNGFECTSQYGLGLPMVEPNYYGYVDEKHPHDLSASQCPVGFCNGQNFLLLPSLLSNSSRWNSTGLPLALQSYLLTQTPCSLNRDPSTVLCGECMDGYVEWRGDCVGDCTGLKVGVLLGFIALTFLFVFILHLLSQRGTGDTKVLFIFVQTALIEVGSFDEWLTFMGLFNFDIAQVSGSTCIYPLTPFQHIGVQILLPIVLMVELIILFGLHRAIETCFRVQVDGQDRSDSFYHRGRRSGIEGDSVAVDHNSMIDYDHNLSTPLTANDSLTPIHTSLNSPPVSLKATSILKASNHATDPFSEQDPAEQNQLADADTGAPNTNWELNAVIMEFQEGVEDKKANAPSPIIDATSSPTALGTDSHLDEEEMKEDVNPISKSTDRQRDGRGVRIGAGEVVPVSLTVPPMGHTMDKETEATSHSQTNSNTRQRGASLSSTFQSIANAFPSTSTAFTRTLLSLFLYSFQHLTATYLLYFDCVQVKNSTVLFNTPSIHCDSHEYHQWLPYIISLLILNILLGPILLVVLLYRHRVIIQSPVTVSSLILESRSSTLFRARYSLFYESYKPANYLWQVFVLIRQIGLVGISLLQTSHQVKYLAFCLFNCFNLLLHVQFQPYVSRTDNRQEGIALQLLLLVSLLLLAFTPPFATWLQVMLCILVIPFTLFQLLSIIHTRIKRIKRRPRRELTASQRMDLKSKQDLH